MNLKMNLFAFRLHLNIFRRCKIDVRRLVFGNTQRTPEIVTKCEELAVVVNKMSVMDSMILRSHNRFCIGRLFRERKKRGSRVSEIS